MVMRIASYLLPDLPSKEVRKFSLLGLAFSLIIGSYWALRLLKNTILYKIAFPVSLGWSEDQGRLMQPIAKFWSPVIVIILVILYSKLVDLFSKKQLFYLLIGFFSTLFALISTALLARHLWGDAFLGKNVLAAIGWISFFGIESFGSLIVALFWSFTSSITSTDSAKQGYPFIAACAQFGALIMSFLPFFAEDLGGIWVVFSIATILVISVAFVISRLMRALPEEVNNHPAVSVSDSTKEDSGKGFFSGLTLLLTRPYLIGILIVSTFYETISQIIEYQMQSNAYVSPVFSGELGFAKFQGIYGIGINIVSFLMALFGTGFLIKKFGLRFCLLFFPAVLIASMGALTLFHYYGNPTPTSTLWMMLAVMMVAKGLGYAVNNPSKEIMYIPTSDEIKFKSKGWIDMFGSRTAKQGGSLVTNHFKQNLTELMFFGSLISVGLSAVWIIAAIYVGTVNRRLVNEKKIIS
jgi:AAA family ATP:ADP antiporter